MVPTIIEYLLSLLGPGGLSVFYTRLSQIIIPSFPPLQTVQYSISLTPDVYGYIFYDFSFGEAMVPHAFDVKINQSGRKFFDAIVSGRFMAIPQYTFSFMTKDTPILVDATNTTLLVQYFETAYQFLVVPAQSDYNTMVDALRRVFTSTKSEELLQEVKTLLQQLVDLEKKMGPRPPIGAR
jgi:hypothetical protein